MTVRHVGFILYIIGTLILLQVNWQISVGVFLCIYGNNLERTR